MGDTFTTWWAAAMAWWNALSIGTRDNIIGGLIVAAVVGMIALLRNSLLTLGRRLFGRKPQAELAEPVAVVAPVPSAAAPTTLVNTQGGPGIGQVHTGEDFVNRDKIIAEQYIAHQVVQIRERGNQPLTNTLPPRNARFVGRKDQLAAIEALLKQQAVIAITSLHGQGGVGKTSLALEAAHRLGAAFPDGRYWLDLRDGDPKRAALILLSQVAPDTRLDERTAFEAVCAQLRNALDGKQVLLVLDNADRIPPDQIRLLCPPAPACVVITSRERTSTLSDTLEVDVLSEGDALAVLRSYGMTLDMQMPDARALVKLLGYLALAVDITTARMTSYTPHQSCASALRDLQGYPDLLSKDGRLVAAFAYSYDPLSPDLKRALHALGLCAASGAPSSAIAAMLAVPEVQAREWLRQLADKSLLTLNGVTMRATLHPLLRDQTRGPALATPEAGRMHLAHAAFFGALLGLYQQAY